jgi:hypothetical protein
MIKFPDKHYAGFQARKDDCNLGFITPYGEDSAAKKRIQTVDNWAKGSYWNKTDEPIPSVVYDNEPMEGFEVRHSVNHSSSWNHCRDKWRILDPRGFELEINSGNLENILSMTTIINGKIQGKCIWAREGAVNILVPVESELYQTAIKNTELSKKKASIKDAMSYDKVTFTDGRIMYYMGYFYPIVRDYSDFMPWVHHSKYHFFKKDLTKEEFFAISSPKIAAIEESLAHQRNLTPKQIQLIINQGESDSSTLMIIGVSLEKEMAIEAIMIPNRTILDMKKNSWHSKAYVPISYKDGLFHEIGSYEMKNDNSKRTFVGANVLDFKEKKYLMTSKSYGWGSGSYQKISEQVIKPYSFNMVEFEFTDSSGETKFRIKQ